MAERPIIMQAESVRAILDGSKTMTRRVVKPGPEQPAALRRGGLWEPSVWRCPYGVSGDQLWVGETWAVHEKYGKVKPSDVWWGATKWYCERGEAGLNRGRWRPSIFMPRWASRITLDVTEVRVERVQDISAEDGAAEGLTTMLGTATVRADFRVLWDSINARRPGCSWESNPFVWVVEFRRIP